MRKTEYPKDASTLGKSIRTKRMDLHLSLDDLAAKTGVTASYLSRIEADKKVPAPELIEKIAKALNTNPDEYKMFLLTDFISTTFSQSSADPNFLLNFQKMMKTTYKDKKIKLPPLS